MDFRSLQHMRDSAIHCSRAFQAHSVRLQGLVTLMAAFARRTRAGFLSRRQRSWELPFGAFSFDAVTGAFPPGLTHLPFVPSVNAPHGWRGAGPTGRGFWVLTRVGSPSRSVGD
jgi:CHASE1-domain containing sensor protein